MAAKKTKKNTKTVTKAARTAARAARPKLTEAKAPERIERKRYTEKLPCAIAPELAVLKGDELAAACIEKGLFKVERAEQNRKARERLAHLDETIADLSAAVNQHVVTREVECVDYLERGHIVTIRQDTLEPIGEPRAATSEDLQESIFAKGEAARERAGLEAEEPAKAPEKDPLADFPDAVHSSFEDDEDDEDDDQGDPANDGEE